MNEIGFVIGVVVLLVVVIRLLLKKEHRPPTFGDAYFDRFILPHYERGLKAGLSHDELNAMVKLAINKVRNPTVIGDTPGRYFCDMVDEWIYSRNPVSEFGMKVDALWERSSEECPNCGSHVEALEQVGRCVYARPCGCRVWQGELPDRWKK